MSAKVTFQAKPRTVTGKKVSSLRRAGSVPANISGQVEKAVPIMVEATAFTHLYHKVGDTGLVYLTVEGEKQDRPVLVSEVQIDPLSERVVHVVFRQVNLNEKVTAEVPVVVIGETPAKNAVVVTVHDAVSVKAFPQDLPEKFEIDLSKLTAVGQMVTFEQLPYDHSKVELDVPVDQLSTPIVMVQEVKEEIEEPTPVAATAETPTGDAAATAPAPDAKAAPDVAKTEKK